MKRIFYLIVLVSLIVVSCKKDERKKLIGKWRKTHEEIICSNPERDSYHVAAGNREINISGYEVLSSLKGKAIQHGEPYQFFDNGKYYHEMEIGWADDGTFELKDDSLYLYHKDAEARYKLNFISENKFVYKETIPLDTNHIHKYTYYYDKE